MRNFMSVFLKKKNAHEYLAIHLRGDLPPSDAKISNFICQES